MKKHAFSKTLAFILALLMMISVTGLTQCKTEASAEDSLYNVDTLPIVNEPITLKILTQDTVKDRPFTTAVEAGIWTWLEEKTGIKLEIESYPAEELKQKLPLIMASPEDYPDLFINCDLKENEILSYGQNGQFLALNDLIEEYGCNIKECFENLDYAYGASVSSDGNIYALPSFNAYQTILDYSMNKEFLEAIGCEAPTTLEELYDVFKLIQEKDANGNGDTNDEICLTGVPKAMKRILLNIVGLNCYWPWEGALVDAKDDEVFFVETTDQYKYLLQWMNKFYEEGMLDNEFFTQTNDQLNEKKNANRCFMYNNHMDPETSPVTGCNFYTPLTSAVNDTPLVSASAPYQVGSGAISAFTKYPEVCMLLLNYLFSEEASKAAYWGIEGIDYKVIDEEKWVIECLGKDDGYIESHKYKTPMIMPYWNRDEWMQPALSTIEQTKLDVQGIYGKYAFQNYLHYTAEESDELAIITSDLNLYLDDHYVGFVTGTYDIDTEWDDYVETCKQLGSERLTEIYQGCYDRFYGLDK